MVVLVGIWGNVVALHMLGGWAALLLAVDSACC